MRLNLSDTDDHTVLSYYTVHYSSYCTVHSQFYTHQMQVMGINCQAFKAWWSDLLQVQMDIHP